MKVHYAKTIMPFCGDILNQKKTIIPLVASMRAKGKRMLTIIYDNSDNADEMYIGVGFTQLSLST